MGTTRTPSPQVDYAGRRPPAQGRMLKALQAGGFVAGPPDRAQDPVSSLS